MVFTTSRWAAKPFFFRLACRKIKKVENLCTTLRQKHPTSSKFPLCTIYSRVSWLFFIRGPYMSEMFFRGSLKADLFGQNWPKNGSLWSKPRTNFRCSADRKWYPDRCLGNTNLLYLTFFSRINVDCCFNFFTTDKILLPYAKHTLFTYIIYMVYNCKLQVNYKLQAWALG